MGQRPTELTPNFSPLHRWGYELRQLRKARGLSLRQLSSKVLIDHSHLGRFERAERKPDLEQVRQLDMALDAGGMLTRHWTDLVAGRGHVASKPKDVASSPEGLVPARAEAARSTDGEVVVPCRTRDGRIRFVAISRRTLLASGSTGLAAAALAPVLGAAPALAVPPTVNGPTPVEHYRAVRRILVQTDNLLGSRHVLSAVQQNAASLKALRRDTAGRDSRDLLELQIRYAEFAGWLAQDLGDVSTATAWTDRALQWAHASGDSSLISYVLGRKSQLAADTGEAMDAVGLAEAAQRSSLPHSRLRAMGEMNRAHGLALLGQEADSLRAYDVALEMVSDVEDPGPWGSWLDPGYVNVQRARSLHVLGHHHQAANGYTEAIVGLPTTYRRDRGVYLGRMAQVHASLGEPERAAALGQEATAIAAETASARIITELDVLDQQLSDRWSRVPQVEDFRRALDGIVHHED